MQGTASPDPSRAPAVAGYDPPVPSMLDLVRLSARLLFPPGGVELYRQIALLTELSPGDEVLDVACGKGVTVEYFVEEYQAVGSGVEIDPRMVEQAEARSREKGIADKLQFQAGRADALPYRDDVFDVTVGELALAAFVDPEDAIRELVRVTKPGGFVVLVQLVWKAPVDQRRQRVLAEHLGARPLMLVEWKRLLKEAGVEALHTEDWSDEETAFRPTVTKPFPDFAEMFSLPEKIGILRRAWRRWGWRGVRAVLEREREVHNLLTRERILGLDLVKGRVTAGSPTPDPDSERKGGPDSEPSDDSREPGGVPGPSPSPKGGAEGRAPDDETAGLPLFRGEEDG